MDYSTELRRKLLLKDEKIRELEATLSEKERIIEDLTAKLDKFQVSESNRTSFTAKAFVSSSIYGHIVLRISLYKLYFA